MDQSYQINYLTFQTSKLLKLNEYTKTWFGLKSGYKVPSDLNVERCIEVVLMSLLLTLSRFHILLWCFHC